MFRKKVWEGLTQTKKIRTSDFCTQNKCKTDQLGQNRTKQTVGWAWQSSREVKEEPSFGFISVIARVVPDYAKRWLFLNFSTTLPRPPNCLFCPCKNRTCGFFLAWVSLHSEHICKSFNDGENGNGNGKESIQLEQEVLMPLAGTSRAFAFTTNRWWSQLKTAGSAIYANRHYLQLFRKQKRTDRLLQSNSPTVIGDVYVHPTASVHPTAVLGPNVSIGANAVVGPGARVRESILLDGVHIDDHSLILQSILGRGSSVGAWARVEGTPCDPNPNKPFAKMENVPLFNSDGRLNPAITILGCNVSVPAEVILLNSIVLPYKELSRSFKNEIIL
ncbi:hypothetical protein B566_EDAN009040 [Ephemera danica]|nr:hypothetical protein B566_EDAN009040 [Ephemera danica]